MSNRGKPRLATKDDNQCEAATVMTEWKIAKKRPQRCPFMAKWVVQGKQFCMHHARMEAIAIGIEKGFITRVIVPHPIAGQRVKVMP